MSRHRIVRNYIGVDSEYYDDEVFGRSVEDDSPLSPSLSQLVFGYFMSFRNEIFTLTMPRFIYTRGSSNQQLGLARNSIDYVQEEEEAAVAGAPAEEALNAMCRYRTFVDYA